MSDTIALEAQLIVREAAGKAAGLIVGAQIRVAARALGYPADSWRIREAWYGRAGCWSAQALRDLQTKYRAWREREAARTAAAEAISARRDIDFLEKARATYAAELEQIERRIAAAKEALRLPDPDTDCP